MFPFEWDKKETRQNTREPLTKEQFDKLVKKWA